MNTPTSEATVAEMTAKEAIETMWAAAQRTHGAHYSPGDALTMELEQTALFAIAINASLIEAADKIADALNRLPVGS